MPRTLLLKLAARQELTSDISEFTFHRADGRSLPAFEAGSHLTVRTPAGEWRSYSLTNDEAERDRYVIAVKREDAGRGGSRSMHHGLREGSVIEVRPPHNAFVIRPARRYLLIGGGIGITPLLSMLRRLTREGADVQMVYLTRSASLTAYRDVLAKEPFKRNVAFHHDGGDRARIFDFWPYFETPDDRHVYYCGPGPLMQAIYSQTVHWPRSHIHSESFAGVATTNVASRPFRLRRAKTAEMFDVPASKSILDVLRAHRIAFESSCESGTCGACRMRLVAGEVEHRDLFLNEDERTRAMMPCVSRAAGDEITLDF